MGAASDVAVRYPLRDILLLRNEKFCHARFMPVPVISIAQMREWERANWAAGRTEMEVIRRVGAVLARRALELTRPGDAILILAGKGHNGDDARAAREFLNGRRVEMLDVVCARKQFAGT